MRLIARNVHVIAAALLPVLVSGSLYLPDTPPPVDHMLRLAGLGLLVAAACVWLPARSTDAATARAAAMSLSVAMALAYPLISGLARIQRVSWADAVFALVYTVGALLILRFVLRRGTRALEETRSTLNLVMPVMLLTVWVFSWQGYVFGPGGSWQSVATELTTPLALGPPRPTDPDIVHVILDGMGRPDELKTIFGVDLQPGLSKLSDDGLHISDSATANYPQTFLSLASMLNMRELAPLADVLSDSSHRGPLIYLIQHSAVIRSLKNRGYYFRFIGSSYAAGTGHHLADECLCDAMPFGELEGGLLAITPARGLPYSRVLYAEHRDEIRTAFARLESLQPLPPPQLVLAHVLAPHPPFVIGPEGDLPDPPQPYALLDGSHYEGTRDHYRAGYARQAEYAVDAVARAFAILRARWASSSSRPLVLIVQGDHGSGLNYDVADTARTDASERLTILLAISWPGVAPDQVPLVDSPVNIYRAVFNQYFGAGLQMLPDRSYLTTFEHPYRLVPVGPSRAPDLRLPATGSTSAQEKTPERRSATTGP
jgi:Sulfatase